MEKFFIAALCQVKFFGFVRIQKLLNCFGNAQSAWFADGNKIKNIGLPDFAVQSFLDFRNKNPNTPTDLMDYCNKKNVGLCSFRDENYPPILKEISSPPPVLYYVGKIQPSAFRIAVIGSRDNSLYGKKIAFDFSAELAAKNISVVSGAARGIDFFAHNGAMKNGRTVAVLGCGIDFIFDSVNFSFLKKIAENGAVISAFNPFLPPSKTTFPARNRIIAGLSKGVIVVEAGEKSGTILTADLAKNFGRDVFAVPGSVFSPKSVGCHNLIRGGAFLISNVNDVLNFYKGVDYG